MGRVTIVAVLLLLCLGAAGVWAYVMQAEQLLSMMAARFSSFRGLSVTQAVTYPRAEGENEEVVLEERLWLKSPGFFRREGPASPPKAGDGPTDLTFYRLLLANDRDALMALLAGMGIRLDKVALTRDDGTVAYRIGEEGQGTPMLLVEKARFLPLLLTYRIPDESEQTLVTVRFGDYREVGKGWYPYEIGVAEGERPKVRHSVRRLELNPLIDPPLQALPLPAAPEPIHPPGTEPMAEETDVREVIRTLREKYPSQ